MSKYWVYRATTTLLLAAALVFVPMSNSMALEHCQADMSVGMAHNSGQTVDPMCQNDIFCDMQETSQMPGDQDCHGACALSCSTSSAVLHTWPQTETSPIATFEAYPFTTAIITLVAFPTPPPRA